MTDPATPPEDTKAPRPYWVLPMLRVPEAAEYIGVSLSQFNDQAQVHGLRSCKIMGRVMYRRAMPTARNSFALPSG